MSRSCHRLNGIPASTSGLRKYDRLYVAIVTPHMDRAYDPDESQLSRAMNAYKKL